MAERGQRIVAEFLRRQGQGDGRPSPDPLNIGTAFLEMTTRLMSNPARLVQAQIGFWQDYLTLWQNTARRMMGGQVDPVIAERKGDKRFKDDAREVAEGFECGILLDGFNDVKENDVIEAFETRAVERTTLDEPSAA